MRRLFLIAAAVAPLVFVATTEAVAQSRSVVGAHGFRGGGFHGGGFGGGRGIHGWRGGGLGWHGAAGWRGANRGFYPRGGAWRGGAWRGGYYRPHYRRWGGNPYWGWGAAGLATALTAGALATYPYDYYYDYPAYPVYPAYGATPASTTGGQCSTPVKICTLYERAPLGIGCSCRVPGGRARGTVVGP